LPPLWQAWHLREWFAGQGVGLSMPDNPVVRAPGARTAHRAGNPYMVVHPGAVFGPVGLVAMIGAGLALSRRNVGDRFLLALTLVPIVFLFVPLVAAGVGAVTVPWMLYRVGWLIPQPLLLARAATTVFRPARPLATAIGLLVWVAMIFALSAPTGADRLRRGMREHPFGYETFPRGTTLAVYRFLDRSDRRGPVLAPVGFSNLVPAMAGRPVVAFSERGLCVRGGEPRAYERLRDRAIFFSCATDAATRRRIAHDYGASHAVFRRRYRTAGDESAWLERSTADGVLLAEDAALPIDCALTEERLARTLPAEWPIVYVNHDYFVVATDVSVAEPPTRGDASTAHGWLDALRVETADVGTGGEVLASATGYPGGESR
jgi:hypothetical protein